jgi:hypothetical protein
LRAILSSLSAFVAAGLRPRTSLAKAIAIVLLVKLIGMAAVSLYVTTNGAEPVVDASAMARVLGVSPAGQ